MRLFLKGCKAKKLDPSAILDFTFNSDRVWCSPEKTKDLLRLAFTKYSAPSAKPLRVRYDDEAALARHDAMTEAGIPVLHHNNEARWHCEPFRGNDRSVKTIPTTELRIMGIAVLVYF